RPLEIQLGDEPTGRALLRALGLDASQVVASFTFASRARAELWITALGWTMVVVMFIVFGLLAAATADLPGPWLPIFAVLAAVILLGWIVVMLMPTRAVVGADGVLVSWFWRKRFLGYGAIRAVRPYGAGNSQGVVLYAALGAPIKLPVQPELTQQQTDQR